MQGDEGTQTREFVNHIGIKTLQERRAGRLSNI